MAPLGVPGPERNFVLAYRRITPVLAAQNVVNFQTEVTVSVWAASTANGSVSKIAQATADELGDVSLTVGSIGPADRPLIFLCGHSGYSLLVNLAYEAIADASGLALVLTGKLHDDSFRNIGEIAPVPLANGQFATTLGNDDGFGLLAYSLSDLSATLIRPLAEATDDQATAIWDDRTYPRRASRRSPLAPRSSRSAPGFRISFRSATMAWSGFSARTRSRSGCLRRDIDRWIARKLPAVAVTLRPASAPFKRSHRLGRRRHQRLTWRRAARAAAPGSPCSCHLPTNSSASRPSFSQSLGRQCLSS